MRKWSIGIGVFCAAALLVPGITPAHALESELLQELESTFVQLGEEVRPGVVNIEADRELEGPSGGMPDTPDMDMFEDLFRFFGVPRDEMGPDPQGPGPQQGPQRPRVPATGSGFIYDEEGHIITNNHVVRNAESITVRLYNGNEYDATVVGGDPDTDVAVIKIDAPEEELSPVTLGDSETLEVGQFALAVGSPQGLEGSLSFGHISALGREELMLPDPDLRFQNFIQTDAAINLGNSGGPLVNIHGEVIGINTAIVFGAENIGFAIPINMASDVIPELIEEGFVTRGYLGVEITDAADLASGLGLPEERGAFVERVREDTPAARAGLQTYDVILSVNGEPIQGASDLVRTISALPPDETVTLGIWREEERIDVDVELAVYDRPDEVAETAPQQDPVGLQVEDIPPELAQRLAPDFELEGGVAVSSVDPDSPAYEAGIRRGDIILEIARQPVNDTSDYEQLMSQHAQPGSSTLVRIFRGGQTTVLSLTIPEQ
ncbi:MAG: PDZ domain-containing protein [Candidatus Hydrogenedentota bacterium]